MIFIIFMLIKKYANIEEIWPKEKRIWTATNIDRATDCVFQFILTEIFKVPYKITPRQALGIFVHRALENFYKPDGKPLYSSAESFANAIAARWQFVFNRENPKIQGREVEFKNKDEIFILKAELKQICSLIYERYKNEEKPIETEFLFAFKFGDKNYRGRIDEIRKNTTIREIKTGKRKPGEMKLKYDPQFTLYALALANICYNSKNFCEKIGTEYKKNINLAEWLDYLSSKLKLEYYFVREDKIYEMSRDYINFNEFQIMVDGLERKIENALIKGIYPERGRRCDTCIVKDFCDKLTQDGLFIYPDWQKIEAKIYALKYNQEKIEHKEKQLSLFPKRRKN